MSFSPTLSSLIFAFRAALALLLFLPFPSQGGEQVLITHPNATLSVRSADLTLKDGIGDLSFEREWNGAEWKFQAKWESLSQSWKNLTGSQTADTTRPVVTGEGAYLPQTEGGPSQGCWVYVEDGMSVEAGSVLSAARSQPFNGQLQESGGEEDYVTPKKHG
jgi:hypothetical protein